MKLFLPAIFLAAASSALAAPGTTYLGIYMQGQKIGYASYATSKGILHGKSYDRSDTKTIMDSGLLGTPLHIEIDSTSYLDANQKPVEMVFSMESQGRRQDVTALFEPKQVSVSISNSGTLSNSTLPMPPGDVVDDPIALILKGKNSGKCYVLDPTTVSFALNTFNVVDKKQVTVDGKRVTETIVDIKDPRENTRVYLSPAGDILRAEGFMGIVMLPVSQEVALAKPSKYSPIVDLAYSNKIVPTGSLPNPAATAELKLRLTGRDISAVPSDEVQSVSKTPEGWLIDIHPPRLEHGLTIAQAAAEKPEWVKPELYMPSDTDSFVKLAKSIAGDEKYAVPAALSIKKWVYGEMSPNASIGVLRDATEVLKTKEGVCRDYAILTGTLLRSAGIPTRLASGLVNWDGTFYYHVWNEIWDGKHWIGIDSTTPDQQLSAAHVKLAEGTVAQAFTFAVLDKVKIGIVASRE
jgi:Transglutaminase-like superfamily